MLARSINMYLVGAFRVVRHDGVDFTPKGARARAVLAVLALSLRLTASRSRLADLIWTDRAPAQAFGSLRAALSEIRATFAPLPEAILSAAQSDVWLNSEAVHIDLINAPDLARGELASGQHLLEGFPNQGEGFEDWLRLKRSWAAGEVDVPKLSTAVTAQTEVPPSLLLQVENSGSHLETFISGGICQNLFKQAQEYIRLKSVRQGEQTTGGVAVGGAQCVVNTLVKGDQAHISMTIVEGGSGHEVWSERFTFRTSENELVDLDAASLFAGEAAEVLANMSSKQGEFGRANLLTVSAAQSIFTFDLKKLQEAEIDLAEAEAIDPHPIRPALRAMLRATMSMEQLDLDLPKLKEESERLLISAREAGNRNALVLSIMADVEDLLFDREDRAFSLAERATFLNPGCGYAWGALGTLEMRRGNLGKAMDYTAKSRRMLARTAFYPWSEMRFSQAAFSGRRFEEAEQAAMNAWSHAPSYRPPLRQLYALNLKLGKEPFAEQLLLRLKRLEPDFSVERLLSDDDYPAVAIRRVGIDPAK